MGAIERHTVELSSPLTRDPVGETGTAVVEGVLAGCNLRKL